LQAARDALETVGSDSAAGRPTPEGSILAAPADRPHQIENGRPGSAAGDGSAGSV
jgi:hypothetical protein